MKVEIITILDRSGSMADLRHDVIGGYNSFIKDQKAGPGEARVTLVQFNSAIEVPYQGVQIGHVAPLTVGTYIPFGSTALYDAIGTTLSRQGARIGADHWADQVIVNIITDGEENASNEFSLAQVKALIAQKQGQAAGWSFLFQAANQDAFETGARYGISGATTSNFAASAAGMAAAYGNVASYTSSLRSGASAAELARAWTKAQEATPEPATSTGAA